MTDLSSTGCNVDCPWEKDKFMYGSINLKGYQFIGGKNPKFVRANKSLQNLPEKLYKLMTEVWNFSKPELIISLNGGAKYMEPLNSDQQLAFKRGLIDISNSASTWIITSGFDAGVSKLVGEASKEFSILSQKQFFTVLGIGIWGSTYDNESLVMKNEDDNVTYRNASRKTIEPGQSQLNPYHDAFILYDDETNRKFGGEIEFRALFEKIASDTAKCSVVQLIVNGGINTIYTGVKALEAKIPVVVMKGSGRAADVICDVLEATDTMRENILKLKYLEFEKGKENSETDKINLIANLKKFFNYNKDEKIVHLFNMSDFKNHLDTAIIEAAFSGEKLTALEKLKLAMIFNRVDVAEENIVIEKITDDLTQHMIFALTEDKWQFMDFFLRHGITMDSVLTKEVLRKLYFDNEANLCSINPIKFYYEYYTNCERNRILTTIWKNINRISRNPVPASKSESISCFCYCCKKMNVIHPQSFVDTFTKNVFSTQKQNDNNDDNNNNNNNNNDSICTEDLFLWALMTQRIEMAKVFLKYVKHHIGSALVASHIFKRLQKKAGEHGEIDIQNNWKKVHEDFETISIGILSEAYRRDQIRTHLLLIRALSYWGNESCLDIANKYKIINFMSHSACHTRLENIWLGKMPKNVWNSQIISNIPFGFLTSRIFIYPYNLCGQKQAGSTSELTENDNPKENVENRNPKDNKKSKIKLKKTEYLSKLKKEQRLPREINFGLAVKYFYNAPVAKFEMYIVSYLAFLTIFSYFILIELNTIQLNMNPVSRATEYTVYAYFISYVIEEIRQFVTGGQTNTLASKFKKWKSSMWNWFDILIFIVFTIGYILRCSGDAYIIYCRTLFAMSLSMFFIRFMEFYYAQKNVGPKVIMINKMFKDIGFFLAIYLIALFAYGTFSLSLLYPNLNTTSLLMRNIIYNPYWQLFGQVDTSYMDGSQTLFGHTATPNAMVIVANAIFLMFSNVLLLNLLIAMFGVTFNKVEKKSNRVWALTRYRMIEEFYYRPIFPPPFNIFGVFHQCFKQIYRKKDNAEKRPDDDFIANLSPEEESECSGFEQKCMETYYMSNSVLDSSPKDSNKIVFKSEDTSTNDQTNTSIESHIKSLVLVTSKIEKDIKTLNDRVYKIRRLQKKKAKSNQE